MQGDILIPAHGIEVAGSLELPDPSQPAAGLVLFAHGSGSSRFSPRNRWVAEVLRQAGLATLLMDLLTPQEDSAYATRFDIRLLTSRLVAATYWALSGPDRVGETGNLPIGYFGASTGAAAALAAAAELGDTVRAVVSRGGRPDLAMEVLPRVSAPTLFIVGGADTPVLDLNRSVLARMQADSELVVIPGATHLFEEPGALDEVARLAAGWLRKHLTGMPEPGA